MLSNMVMSLITLRYETPFGIIMLIIGAILIGVSKYIANAIAKDEEKQEILRLVIYVIGIAIIIASKFVDSAMAID
ncbi:hypothetical protein SAMN02910353_02226 [Ruminococcus sp. YRD2003]|uniref:hypothetical protein n=1 Tax=Ruminococcus sp. YRD2003 TaxID=1452313 RepID=UPI0008C22A3A|nr:hypothetical protein [Ruminococcus sp.]SEL26101.1 hypothetical protein SAMN02910353_02226 [Ruminococcus flavefaciens]